MCELLCVCLLIIKIVGISSQSCHYVSDLTVNHRDLADSYWDRTSVTGCISDTSFRNKLVEDLNITCDTVVIPTLEKQFISNMTLLKIILIDSCHAETIEPGAFFNLPQLRALKIEGNPLKAIARGVFDVLSSLQKLYIYYNKISTIEDHAFANLPNLRSFSLESNKLDHLKKEWFTNTTNIQEFLANQNCISQIPQEMFLGWKKLAELNLNSNAVSLIEDGTFNDVAPFMEYLSLHHNRLTSISVKAFSSSVFIDNLFLSGNLFNYLSTDFLEKIRVNNLYIFSNPFICPCLDKINKILLDRDITVDDPTDTYYVKACKMSDVPVCGFSSNGSKSCTDFVDKEVTRRVISQMKNNGYHNVRTEADEQCAMFEYED